MNTNASNYIRGSQMNKNLEALIEEHAKVMADQMVKAAVGQF